MSSFSISSLVRDVALDDDTNMLSFKLMTTDSRMAMIFRRGLMAYVRSYAPYSVRMLSHAVDVTDFMIATSLTRASVDNRIIEDMEGYIGNIPEDGLGQLIRGYFDVTGPGVFSTKDIKGIPWYNDCHIAPITKGVHLQGEVDVRSNDAAYHCKHQVFMPFLPKRVEDYFLFQCEVRGNLSLKQMTDQFDFCYKKSLLDPNETIMTMIEKPEEPSPTSSSSSSSNVKSRKQRNAERNARK